MIPSYINGCIRNLEELDPNAFTIENIAGALSKVNRFNGQTPYPYSVAQHSVLVSHLVRRTQALEGLFHDAGEAFVGDLSKWIKPHCPAFVELEATIVDRVNERFALYPDHEEIKRADAIALRLEQMHVQKRVAFYDWERIDIPPPTSTFVHLTQEMPWKDAMLLFLVRYAELTRWRQ